MFSAGGARRLADEYGFLFLGSIPLDQVCSSMFFEKLEASLC